MPKRTVNQWHYIVESIHTYNVLLDTREIFLHGSMDVNEELEDSGVDHRMANKFVKNMRLLETLPQSEKPIVVHQHSVGGDWYAGMMIYDTIAQCKCPVLFIYHGLAASMGSVIPQACVGHGNAWRVAMPQSWFMIHDGTTDITPNHSYKQSQSMGTLEKGQRKLMLDFYVKGCLKAPFFKDHDEEGVKDHILKQMDSKDDWWLNARDMVTYGFADGIMGQEGFESIDHILKSW